MRPTTDLSTPLWHKSSYSNSNGGECVEVNDATPGAVLVRDSKDPDGPRLTFDRDAWSSFLAFAAEHHA